MPLGSNRIRNNALFRILEPILERFNIRLTTEFVSNVLAVIVGVLTGYSVVIFTEMIDWCEKLFFVVGRALLSFMGDYYVVLIPAIGGLIVGPFVYFTAREAKGHGVPEVMTAVALKGGRIRARVAWVKAVSSSICIGSGGSVGREGPVVQIGSTIGSSIGQLLGLRPDLIKGLVACGAAGGISAVFNSPLAVVIFALELILGNFSVNTFVSLVLSSVGANVVMRYYCGGASIFTVPEYTYAGPHEVVFYIVLGVVSGLVALAYVKFMYACEDYVDKIKFPQYLKTPIGGLLLGGIGFYYFQVLGGGYGDITQALLGNMGFKLMAILVVMKILATSLCIATGGSGGVFAPTFFVGAMTGGAMGSLFLKLYPSLVTPSGAYSLVGMGAVFAAATGAPITSIVIMFEITNDYHLIVPIMLSCIIAYIVFKQLSREDIHTEKLVREGIYLHGGRDLNVLQDIMVRDIMGKEVEVVKEEMTVQELSDLIRLTDHMGFPVINERSELTGVVTFNDFQYIKPGSDWNKLTVKDIYKTDLVVTYPDETLDDVMHKLGMRHVGRLPVVDRANPTRILGLVTRTDIVNAYSKYLTFKKYE